MIIELCMPCGIVSLLVVMFALLYGEQIKRHLRGNVEQWRKDAEAKDDRA